MAKQPAPHFHLELTYLPPCMREAHGVHTLRADKDLLSWKHHKDDVVESARCQEQKARDHMCYDHLLK